MSADGFDARFPDLVLAARDGDLVAALDLVDLARACEDHESVRRWLTAAADLHDTEAMYELGVLELSEGDTGAAFAWLSEAAQDGVVPAMYELGILDLASGNTEDAQAWLVQAAEEGHAPALDLLRSLNADTEPDPSSV